MDHFLRTIWRTAVRERTYAAINLFGLALAFGCCLVLGQFVYRGLTYDRHSPDAQRVYRLVENFAIGGLVNDITPVPRATAPLLAADRPQIESWTRLTEAGEQDGTWLRHGDRVLNWRQAFYADAATFDVLPHKVLAGDARTALRPANTVAVSARLARAYFGNSNPMGQLLYNDAGVAWQVALVFADLPLNTHLRYDALFSVTGSHLRDAAGVTELRQQLMQGADAYTYLKVRPGFDPRDWPQISDDFVQRYLKDVGFPPDAKFRLWLQPLAQTHYMPGLRGDEPTGNPAYLNGCLAVALLILVVACINYTNLAAARALRRSRSVAFRRIVGASRSRLLLEGLGEAVLYALLAALLGLALAALAAGFTPLGALLGQDMTAEVFANPALVGLVLCAAAAVGIVAGLWPAVYQSAWMPVAAFSSRGGGSVHGARVRAALVLLQFVLAIGVLACTLVMSAQMRFVSTAPLGFNRDNQVMVALRGADNFPRLPVLMQQLRQLPEVMAVAHAGQPVGHFSMTVTAGSSDTGGSFSMQFSSTDVSPGFIQALGIGLVAGRDFSDELRGGRQVIINESMARQLRWKDAVGQPLLGARVVGVVRDFHFGSLRDPIGPMMLESQRDLDNVPAARRPFQQRTLFIHVTGRNFAGTVQRIEKVMREFDPTHPFEYTLLDESLGQLYVEERRMTRLIATFACLCVLIACLGLFGLTAFDTERRARELAIRKVLGASSSQIIALLARRMLLLIGAGGVLAMAIAWMVMNEWLSGFAYRVDVNPGLMVLSIILAAAVAVITVGLQSLKTARANPVDALRAE